MLKYSQVELSVKFNSTFFVYERFNIFSVLWGLDGSRLLWFFKGKGIKMICKGCKKDKKLIKAHIIPRSFWIELNEGERPPKLLSNTEGYFPKKVPIGIYDRTILCSDCEQKFQEIDSYGKQLLLADKDKQKEVINDEKVIGFIAEEFNYDLLKLFFISILWRASVSSHKFYSRIKLGPFEERAKQMIWENCAGEHGDFSCFLARFSDELGRSLFMDPHREKRGGVNFYRFYLLGYVLYIKVDKRPTPVSWEPFVIKRNSPLCIISRDLNNSKEYKVIRNLVKNAFK